MKISAIMGLALMAISIGMAIMLLNGLYICPCCPVALALVGIVLFVRGLRN